jgi:hypothetical protein
MFLEQGRWRLTADHFIRGLFGDAPLSTKMSPLEIPLGVNLNLNLIKSVKDRINEKISPNSSKPKPIYL